MEHFRIWYDSKAIGLLLEHARRHKWSRVNGSPNRSSDATVGKFPAKYRKNQRYIWSYPILEISKYLQPFFIILFLFLPILSGDRAKVVVQIWQIFTRRVLLLSAFMMVFATQESPDYASIMSTIFEWNRWDAFIRHFRRYSFTIKRCWGDIRSFIAREGHTPLTELKLRSRPIILPRLQKCSRPAYLKYCFSWAQKLTRNKIGAWLGISKYNTQRASREVRQSTFQLYIFTLKIYIKWVVTELFQVVGLHHVTLYLYVKVSKGCLLLP